MTSSSRVYDLARLGLDLLIDRWPTDGSALPLPEREFVNSGNVVWDCEQIVASIERTFGIGGDVTVEQLIPDTGAIALRAVTIAFFIIRCAPDMDLSGDNVILPSAAAIEGNTQDLLADQQQVLAILAKAQRQHDYAGCESLAFENGQALGPEGGFAGWVTRVRMGLV